MSAVKIEFSKGWPTAYDENDNEVAVPEWLRHTWATGHAAIFRHGEDIVCGDCPWPNIPKNPAPCPHCKGMGFQW